MTNQDNDGKQDGSAPVGDAAKSAAAMTAKFQELVREHHKWFLVLGIVWIILGSAAIILPNIASIAVELMVGWLLLFGGAAALIHAFRCKGWKSAALSVISGLLYLAAGIILLLFPLQGVLTLTLLLVVFFVVEGILRCVIAFQTRPAEGWGWLLAGGVATVVVGLLIWGGYPSSSAWAIGLLVGIQLIFSGWAMIAVANAAKGN